MRYRRVVVLAGLLAGGSLEIAEAEASSTGPQLAPQVRGSYVWIPGAASLTTAARPVAGGSPQVLYLNRCAGGLTINPGFPDSSIDNQSSILEGAVTLPEYPYGDGSWNQVVAEAREIFSPFNIVVTDVDPSPSPHDEALVCGSGADAGFSGAGGVAPFSCGVINNAITYTFPESIGSSPRIIAEVVAQEAAHAWGLDHSFKCEDPMTYLSGCGEKTFQDGDFECGEFSARDCQCGGPTQNSYRHIADLFGSAVPDTQAPTVVVSYPSDGDGFDVGADFDVTIEVSDDVGVATASLFINGDPVAEDLNEPFGPWGVTNLPAGNYEIYVEVTDRAGNAAVSSPIAIYATVEGAASTASDVGEDQTGGSDEGAFGGSGGSGGSADGGGVQESDGLPPGYGGSERAATVSACAAGGRSPIGLWGLALIGLGAWRRREPSRP